MLRRPTFTALRDMATAVLSAPFRRGLTLHRSGNRSEPGNQRLSRLHRRSKHGMM